MTVSTPKHHSGAALGILEAGSDEFGIRLHAILGSELKPSKVLQHLVESADVKQSHLWEVFGSKGIASEVLNGMRGISKTRARALANYFHVPADLFI